MFLHDCSQVCLPGTRRVAIIGTGPTGLSAAYDLRRHGYEVALFDSLPQVGGALTDAISDTRLPKRLTMHDAALLQHLGVTFHLHTTVGQDLPFSALQPHFDAILMTIGTQQNRESCISGEDLLSGVLPARQFLHTLTSNQKGLQGKEVVVIGGDRTAVYAARAALQAGAKKVQLLFNKRKSMLTASPEEAQAAIEEGVYLHELVKPRNFIETEEATLHAIRCNLMELSEPDDQGLPHLERVYGNSMVFPADIALVAAGEYSDLSGFPGALRVRQTKREDEQWRDEDYLTSVPGVFVAGGGLYGPGSITQAIVQGKQVARVIAAFLEGGTSSDIPDLPDDELVIAQAIMLTNLCKTFGNNNTRVLPDLTHATFGYRSMPSGGYVLLADPPATPEVSDAH